MEKMKIVGFLTVIAWIGAWSGEWSVAGMSKPLELVRIQGKIGKGLEEYQMSVIEETHEGIAEIQLQKIENGILTGEARKVPVENFMSPDGEALLKIKKAGIPVEVIRIKAGEGFLPDRGGEVSIRFLHNFVSNNYKTLKFRVAKRNTDSKGSAWVLGAITPQEKIVDRRGSGARTQVVPDELKPGTPVKKVNLTTKMLGSMAIGIETWELLE